MCELANKNLTGRIIAAAIAVHRALGPGFLESVYEEALAVELRHQGIPFERQKTIGISSRNEAVGEHRLDLLVAGKVVVELKAVREREDIFFAQVCSYMKALGVESGLWLDFAAMPLTVKRVAREWSDNRAYGGGSPSGDYAPSRVPDSKRSYTYMSYLLPIVLCSGLVLAAEGSPAPVAGSKSDYHGFDRYDFVVDGRNALLVLPKTAAPGTPWIWRAEFFDHRPETDLALLDKGFHLAFIDVGNTFGCPDAMAHWDVFYKLLTERYELSKKPVLEGLSRGGLYVYNWAAANPDKVACIYGDNPVCDFKSWPGGKIQGPGSPDDWKELIRVYHFASEQDALAYDKSPIDNLKPLADAKIPIIHVCGDADEVVPYSENTVILKERYERLGGSITVIVKPGFKHHPHGLDDPTPVVAFILEHTPETSKIPERSPVP